MRWMHLVAPMLILPPAYAWWAARRAYGFVPVGAGWTTARLTLKTRKGPLLVLAAWCVVSAVGRVVLPAWFPPLLPFPLDLVLGAAVLAALSLPPAVLLLGASKELDASLVTELAGRIAPLRVVHLLEPWRHLASPVVATAYVEDARFHCLRTLRERSWRGVVRGFVAVAPLVVVDAREVSDAAAEEVRWIEASGALAKTVFLVLPTGESPLLRAVWGAPPWPVQTTDRERLLFSLSGVP